MRHFTLGGISTSLIPSSQNAIFRKNLNAIASAIPNFDAATIVADINSFELRIGGRGCGDCLNYFGPRRVSASGTVREYELGYSPADVRRMREYANAFSGPYRETKYAILIEIDFSTAKARGKRAALVPKGKTLAGVAASL